MTVEQTVEDALAQSVAWLERADELARTTSVRKLDDTAYLVNAYAVAADSWTRVAELHAALQGRTVPPIETVDQRYAAAVNAQHRRVADAQLHARDEVV
jgi:hypothetical protein